MIIWLASYPRSGNSFLRAVLYRVFGIRSNTVYSAAAGPSDVGQSLDTMGQLVGQEEDRCDLAAWRADSRTHFVKTHEMPPPGEAPAVVLVRDGRDAAVSYAHFILKTERNIDRPTKNLFHKTLRDVIAGDSFGGWSRNVNAWIERSGSQSVVQFEALLKDPVNITAATLERLGIHRKTAGTPPSFEELHAAIPWFFRSGKPGSWAEEMPSDLHRLFLERHGETLLRLGYSEPVLTRRAATWWR